MEETNPLKMKVTELKAELGKRSLSQTGLKFDLAQRLQSAMDVEEFGALPSVSSVSSPLPCLEPSCDNATPNTPAASDEGSVGLTPTSTEEQEPRQHSNPCHRSQHDTDTRRSMLVEAHREASKAEIQIDTALESKAPSPQAENAEGQPESDLAAGDAENQVLRDSGSDTFAEPNNERSGGCGVEEEKHADNSCATAVELETTSKTDWSTITPLDEAKEYPRNDEGCIMEQSAGGGVDNQILFEPEEEDPDQDAKPLRREPGLTREYSRGADNDGPVDSKTSMAADLRSEESPLTYDETDRMKDREQRFGQGHMADDSGGGQLRCINDVVDLGCPSGVLDRASASRAVVPRASSEDTRIKLIKRKARFETLRPPHSAREAAGVVGSEVPRGEPTKMARRAERFAVKTGTCNEPSATPCASVPGPGSGSNGTDPSTAGVGAQPSTCAGDRFEFDPLPQRAKRSRPRATLSETDGTPAQRRGTAGDGEGGTTLAIPTSGSSECTASPQENNDASPRDSNPATLEAEKLRQRKVRFLSVTARPTGDVGPLQRGRIPSPPPRASAESRSSSPTRTVSSRSSERFRVMSGPLPTKGYVMLPRFKCSSDAQRKTSEQAAKMRERQKRFSGDSRRIINRSSY